LSAINDVRTQLEEDLTWRMDELRHLRNTLLGSVKPGDWPVHALRAIMVLQYAHLEGFARNAFATYLDAVNGQQLQATEAHPHLFATALTPEFDAIRRGSTSDVESDDGRLMRRAKSQVGFVEKLREVNQDVLVIDVDSSISMEMNFGADVFRRTLYRLGIPETEVHKTYYASLEFIRRLRNDIAHGMRKERIPSGEFEAHQRKGQEFMNELTRLITTAVSSEMFRLPAQQVT
jgi:MAE_28990/MAE_18760-like HEPN